jgi:hypothetical protein
MLNAAYAIGAGFLLKDGFKELSTHQKTLWPKFTQGFSLDGMLHASRGISKNLWMGALVGGGAVSGLLIKEDPDAKKHAAHGNIFQRAAAYIKEKPLRLTGTLYGANNIFTVLKAYEDYANRGLYSGAVKPHVFSGTTAATYIISNILLTTVSRDQASAKQMPAEQLLQLEDAAARMIAAQPEEKRHALIMDVSHFLSKEKGAGLNAAKIEDQLRWKMVRILDPETMEFSDRVEKEVNAIASLPINMQQASIEEAYKTLVNAVSEKLAQKSSAYRPAAIKEDLIRLVDQKNRETHPDEKDTWVAREAQKSEEEFGDRHHAPSSTFVEKEHGRRAEAESQEATLSV